VAKRRIGGRLGSSATAGEGTQNLLCAYLAVAVFAGRRAAARGALAEGFDDCLAFRRSQVGAGLFDVALQV
jgi:hypothetical protein